MRAQWDVLFSQYWALKNYYNPSFSGETEAIRTVALYRSQWTAIRGAPKFMIAAADMPFLFLGQHHGIGLITFSENIGQTRNSLLAGQYTFRKSIGENSFAIGVQAGMYSIGFDAGNLHVISDSIQNNNINMIRANTTEKKALDINTGISWSGKNIYAGVSALHLTQPGFYAQRDSLSTSDAHTDSAQIRISRSYNLVAACNISLFHPLEIQPMFMLQSDLIMTQMQATLRIVYDKKFSGGTSWCKNDGFVFFAGAVIQEIEAGYAYNLHIRGIGKESQGSHEIYLRYHFPIDIFKGKKVPHKSVRIL